MDPQTLSTVMVAVLLAVSTLGARYSTQGRRQARELRRQRAELDAAERHIYELRRDLRRAGVEPPPLPTSMMPAGTEDEE